MELPALLVALFSAMGIDPYCFELTLGGRRLDEVKKSFQNYQRLKKISNSGGLKILVLDRLGEVVGLGSFPEGKNKDVNYSEDPLYTLFEDMGISVSNTQ